MEDFVVVGSGVFPWDMLRYDSCHPVTGEDAARLTDTGRRSIKMRTHNGNNVVCCGRWSSFGWTCSFEGQPLWVDHHTRKLP